MSREEAETALYWMLVEVVVDDAVPLITETATFASLGLTTKQLRSIWSRFFVATDVDCRMNPDGTTEYLVDEGQLPPLPERVGAMVDEIFDHYRYPLIRSCDRHYNPG